MTVIWGTIRYDAFMGSPLYYGLRTLNRNTRAECPHVRGYHESEGAKKISCGVQRTLKSVSILSRAGVLAPMGAQGLQNTPPRPHTAVKPYSSATQRCQVREQATKIEARRWSSWPHRPRILMSKIWGIHLQL